MALAIVFGILLALLRLSRFRLLRWVAGAWMEFWRGVPVLVLLIWLFYGIGAFFGLGWSPWLAGTLILAFVYGAYLSEVYRAGIEAVPRGQRQAARALGFSNAKTMRHVVVPQALRITVPPVVNNFVGLLKDSALVSVIGLFDLMRMTQQAVTYTYRPFELYTVATGMYLVGILSISSLGQWLERRVRIAGLGSW
jgi:His/Glu/Gln/Arg/opine family amino acid ABC transporter permease subunit